MEMDSLTEIKQNLGKLMELPLKELEMKAYYNLLVQELQHIEIEIIKITQKHGVKTVAEFDNWLESGKIAEAEGWENFFTLDALDFKRAQIKEMLMNF
jgi:hypothetical protein